MKRVYVSSTFLDLQDYRRAVSVVLRQMGYADVAMEYYVASDERPVEKCLADVASCDLYVGIFAWRYGWIPTKGNPKKLSITEMEFRQALKEGKKCLIFLLDGKTHWPPDFIDDDKKSIKKLRDESGEEHGAVVFSSPGDLASQVGAAIHNWAKEQGHLSGETLIPAFDLTAYFAALTKRYQRLDLDALTLPQKEEYLQLQLRSTYVEQNVRENPPPVELPKEVWERLQRDKEIHPEDLPAGVTPEDVLGAHKIYYEQPLRPVLDAITDVRQQHSIILGDPGAGKSTLARYVLLSLINDAGDEKLRRTFAGYLPLLIELRSYTGACADRKCESFLEFLDYMSKNEGWRLNRDALQHYLKTDGRAVVVFDGLDEIFDPEQREQVARRIVGFASDYPKAHIVVTSRVIGYRRKILTGAGFVHFTLQDLNEEQVAKFVDQWYALALSDRPEEATARRARILRSFADSPSIRQLAGNPMLLTIMAIIGKNQELPRERWKLYEHAASVLIQHWDVDKHLQDHNLKADFIGEEDKKELLRRLAYKMQAGAGGLAGNYIHREELQAEFENYLAERYSQTPDRAATIARAMIEQFRERNFILSLYGANLYGFVHRAFLEYFCATAIIHKFEKTREITPEQLKEDVYGAHVEDKSWHEVLRLICGLLDEKFAGEIINYLTNKTRPSEYSSDAPPWNLALAIQCLNEVRNINTVAEPARHLLKAVCSLFEHLITPPTGYYAAMYHLSAFLEDPIATSAEAIGANWPHRDELTRWLRQLNPSGDYWRASNAYGKFVGSVGQGLDEVHQVVLSYAVHQNQGLRGLAPSILAVGWHDNPQTLGLLYDLALEGESYIVRHNAVQSLCEYFTNDNRLVPLLHQLISNDKSSRVRITAIFNLVKHFRDEPETLGLLHKLAHHDKDLNIHSTIILTLGRYFRDDAETLPLLHNYALGNQFPAPQEGDFDPVSSQALETLFENWPNHPDTLPLLRELEKNDRYKSVRKYAKALADHLEGIGSV